MTSSLALNSIENVTVNVISDLKSPVALNDTATTLEEKAVKIAVLSNDSDPNPADVLSIISVSGATHGTAVINADKTITYTPFANYAGSDSFSYTISDGQGGSSTATVAMTVTGVNDAPLGTDKTIALLEDGSYVFTAADFGMTDSNDSPANLLAAVKISTLPVAGGLFLNGSAVSLSQFISAADITAGKLVFKPAADANGINYATFNFQVQDNGGTANGGGRFRSNTSQNHDRCNRCR